MGEVSGLRWHNWEWTPVSRVLTASLSRAMLIKLPSTRDIQSSLGQKGAESCMTKLIHQTLNFFFFTVGLLRPFNELILAVNLQKWGAFSKNCNTKPISCRTQLRKKPVHGHFTNTQCSGLLHAGIQNPAITDYKASCFHSIPSQALPIYECSQQIQNLPTGKWVSKLWDISDRSRWNLCQQFSALPQDSQPWVLTHHVASNYGKSVFELRKGEFTVQYYFKLTLIIKN